MSFINGASIFFAIVIGVIVIAAGNTFFKHKTNPKDWFKTEEGKGSIASALRAIVGILILAFILNVILSAIFASKAEASPFNNGTWFNDASVYIGLEYPKEESPVCRDNDLDNRGTSNLGAKLNIWQSRHKNVRVNAIYTHHSCFIGPDIDTYDAFGVQAEWFFFRRNQ